jgi:hypothetical protein
MLSAARDASEVACRNSIAIHLSDLAPRTHTGRKHSLDDVMGAAHKRWRDVKTQCLSGLHIDHEFKSYRSLDGKLARLLTLRRRSA